MTRGLDGIQRFETSAGRTVYGFPVEAFPNFIANVYLVSDGERRLLVDCGSAMDQSNKDLVARLAEIEETWGEPVSLATLDKILITHGHNDHFGGLSFIREHTDAPVGIHILDRRTVSHHEERVIVASKQLAVFLQQSGLSESARERLMQMYLIPKSLTKSCPIDFEIAEGEEPDPGIEVFHVPGHCPGQVCLKVDDVLLSADHVLSRITPHQAPESITLNMGLGHYLDSLDKIKDVDGVRVALGGHEQPIDELEVRVEAIKEAHDERLSKVLDLCTEPRSTADISRHLFGEVQGYVVLQALEEAGAHVEYLYARGELVAGNVSELRDQEELVVQYLRA